MKKLIYGFGVVFLVIVTILNVLFTANLDASEHITINRNSIIYIVGLILTGLVIFGVTKMIHRKLYHNEDLEVKKKTRKRVFVLVLAIYIIFNIAWVIMVRPGIVGDQIHACNLAQTFYRGNLEEFLPNLTYAGIPLSDYMQAYHQQISLAFVFSIFFRIIHFDEIGVLRALNVICNLLIVFAIYKINRQLSKQYKTNKVLLFTLLFTFVSLPMLTTFIYGDIPSLALCLFSVYFMMRYIETKKIKYPIFASIFTMIAYMMRMNSLIFIIATVIYLLLNLWKEIKQKPWKENLLNLLIIVGYIVVSIVPTIIVQNYYLDKYNMDKNKSYPNISYFLMAMEESWRGNGWYNEDIGEPALRRLGDIREEYAERIKQRLTYFSENIGDMFDFYTKKVTSMWAENTYSAVRSNVVGEEDPKENMSEPLMFYQKALMITTSVCCLIILIQNRNKLSLDVLFLITIFAGGFAFHVLWEAKSRYIIPYIVVLVPVASIMMNQFSTIEKLKSKFKKVEDKI